MSSLPPLRAVQAFETVARCGSVVMAAEELGVSPGAVSQQLHNLETVLNVRLFERRGRSLGLTAWGRIYYERVRQAFDQLRTGQDDLQRAKSKAGIVFSALPSLALRWVRPLLLQWRTIHEATGTRLIGSDDETVFERDHIDFRLSYGRACRQYDQYTELFTDRFVPVCSPGLLKKYPVSTPREILQVPRIDIEWDVRFQKAPSWADWARSIGAEPPERSDELAFSLSSAAIDAAVHDGGFVLGQISMVADDVRSGRLVIPFDERINMPEPYFLAWDQSVLDRPMGLEFRNFIIAAARHQAALSDGRIALMSDIATLPPQAIVVPSV